MNVSYELKLPALLYHRYSAGEDFASPEDVVGVG